MSCQVAADLGAMTVVRHRPRVGQAVPVIGPLFDEATRVPAALERRAGGLRAQTDGSKATREIREGNGVRAAARALGHRQVEFVGVPTSRW